MTHSKIEKPGIDIYTCPQPDITNATEISIGDLHANAMLMMYFLVTNGVVKISDEKYAQLKDIYLKSPLNKSDIEVFNKIIDELEIGEKPLIRLIGDEICDRGQNDYFIFKILDKLTKSGVQTEILLSNHGIEFMIPYEQKKFEELYAPNIGFLGQSRSMDNMRTLVENGVITKDEVDTLVKESYLPNLKLISYTLDGNNITIYSHAGIGLETIRSLAEKFKADGVVYKDDTAEDLARTIEAINSVFDKHVKAGTVHTLTVNISNSYDYQNDPVTFLIWNRGYFNLSREQAHNGYQMFYAHGHDSGDLTKNNIINLDNTLGKGATANLGTYRVLGVQGGPVAQLKAHAEEKIDIGAKSNKEEQPFEVPVKSPGLDVRIEPGVPEQSIVDQNKSKPQRAPQDLVSPFHSELSKLEAKAKLLLKDGHKDAYASAMNIHTTFTQAFKQLQKDGDQQTFNTTCTDVLAKERPQLEKHRGWSEFLINLAIAIPTVGIGLLVKGAINLSQNKSFFFVHQTESSKIVDEIQDKLDQGPANKI
ncbi:Dot/Icm T4SS effector Wip [Legionella quateirensis]|uniref:Dot/Icm secretion system substrate n=1 Tax=Legionella quateirensis TaxID=45072 RepID=A0A378KUN1_9GAMM|nr:Dot/Icm T4SS effector Wip [Legionella quateirensis]KTD43389.1 hypothetical protein Lqua_3290 [Legionella quateirensis]STY18272.1 Dot/Icm secretion system substrate [Legionella quateirensis]